MLMSEGCVTFYFKLFRKSHVAMDWEAYLCGRETKLGKLLFTMNILPPLRIEQTKHKVHGP